MFQVEFVCPGCKAKWKKNVKRVPKRVNNVLCSSCRTNDLKQGVDSDKSCAACKFWQDDVGSNKHYKWCSNIESDITELTYFSDGCDKWSGDEH